MAKYKGRTVKLNKIQRGDVKKFKVFVKDRSSGRVEKDHLWLVSSLSWQRCEDKRI